MTIIIKSLKKMINHQKNIAHNLYKVSFRKKEILKFLKIMIKLKKKKVLMNYKLNLKIRINAFKNMKR